MNPDIILLDDPVYTLPQVARYLQISRSKIYYLASRKRIPVLRLGKNLRIRKSDLKAWLDQQIEKA